MEEMRVGFGEVVEEEVYPTPLLSHVEVCMNRQAFMETLRRFHCEMGTRFMVPVIGGKDLDLHLLYVQVTERGGVEEVIMERRWKEVMVGFNFPATTTSASFVLRKYYLTLLYHYEQVYYFRAQGPLIPPAALLQTKSYLQSIPDPVMAAFRRRKRTFAETQSQVAQSLPNHHHHVNGNGLAASGSAPPPNVIGESRPAVVAQSYLPTFGNVLPAANPVHVAPTRPVTPAIGVPVAAATGVPAVAATGVPAAAARGVPAIATTGPNNLRVAGTIDGKFEHGYLVTVKVGSQTLRGALYPVADHPPAAASSTTTIPATLANVVVPHTPIAHVHRRQRRLRYRDPSHPKPNRSAYNFFFSEKHSRLKAIFPHREREFSRMIGESWNKLTEEEREVYNTFGRRDKERYRMEMQEYRERLNLAPPRVARMNEVARAESSNMSPTI